MEKEALLKRLKAGMVIILLVLMVSCSGPNQQVSQSRNRLTLDEVEILKIEWKDDIPQKTSYAKVPLLYTVRKGDTLFSIGRKFGITVDAIRKLNSLSSDIIKPGKRLRLKR